MGIVVLLVGLSAVVFFGAADEQQPAPEASLAMEPIDGSDDYRLRMQSGETIDGDNLRVVGVQDSDALAGSTLVAGRSIELTPTADTVRVVWRAQTGDRATYTLQTFDVEPAPAAGGGGGGGASPSTFPGGTVFTGTDGDVVQIAGDGGAVTTLLDAGDIDALGSVGPDITGDGSPDVPLITDSGVVNVVDPAGDVTTITDSAALSGDSIQTQKTRPAIAAWDGSPVSVFFVGQNNDAIYRSTPTSGVTTVATLGNGAQAIAGPADVDGDGDDELVYADGSQTMRYLEPGGGVVDTSISLGSSTGIGTGSVGTLAGYPSEVAVGVGGGNYIRVYSQAGTDKIQSGDVASGSAPQATKSPVTVADVDGDSDTEVVYVGASGGDLKYLDDFGGTITVEFLRDENGNKIEGDAGSGVG
jgi:hypothetical protein